MKSYEIKILVLTIISLTVVVGIYACRGIDGIIAKIYMLVVGAPIGYIIKSFIGRKIQ